MEFALLCFPPRAYRMRGEEVDPRSRQRRDSREQGKRVWILRTMQGKRGTVSVVISGKFQCLAIRGFRIEPERSLSQQSPPSQQAMQNMCLPILIKCTSCLIFTNRTLPYILGGSSLLFIGCHKSIYIYSHCKLIKILKKIYRTAPAKPYGIGNACNRSFSLSRNALRHVC